MFSSSVVPGLKASSAWAQIKKRVRKKEKFKQPLKDSSYKGRVLSQVLISVSQSNFDSYKYPCSFLNDNWHCEYSREKQ